jgi:CheY-like chemotaxis protein
MEWHKKLSGISHEIRTPMNSIIGMADLLAHEPLNERQMSYVNDINASARSLLSLINGLLGNKDEAKPVNKLRKDLTLSAPCAAVLVVDDNEFNIRVAQGLLGLFKINAKTALSGKEAIDMIKQNEFDIVFMDHMMPEMDGVEAAAEIRKLGAPYESLPIVALTANAVKGAKEMFLSNGFDGFISKPIDMLELEDVLREWLPPEKIEETEPAALDGAGGGFILALESIEEINAEIGLSRFSRKANLYHETLEFFYNCVIKECADMSASLNANNIKNFGISVHSMKSELSAVGAMQLSEMALKLETAAKKNDSEYCQSRYPELKEKLLSLHERLSIVFPEKKAESAKGEGDAEYMRENVKKALLAADDFDADAGFNAISGLLEYDFGAENNTLIKNKEEAFRSFDYGAAKGFLSRLPPVL